MSTQYEEARDGRITPAMRHAAEQERQPPEKVRDELAAGRAALPANPAHTGLQPSVVGVAFKTKVNANIGRSTERSDDLEEAFKLKVTLEAGADCVMDLSVGRDLGALRRNLLEACPLPFGTVPIYEAISRVGGKAMDLSAPLLLDVIKTQAEQGVDFMTLHAGFLRRYVPMAVKRLAGIVSRGGALIADWMIEHHRENPLYEAFDEVLALCHKHDVTISLGDGLRPGCQADAGDAAQYAELDTLGDLVRRCRQAGVQVMVEGPGHVPFHEIKAQMEKEALVCDGAPFYVLGPVVTDVAPGYDHITAAIGATAAAAWGASLLCYVTPAEHLGLPTAKEVHEGIMAFRIAAHAGDLARGIPNARQWDDDMTRARTQFNWCRQFELALDGKRARARFRQSRPDVADDTDHCTMCGAEFCAMRISKSVTDKLAAKKK